MTLKFFLCFYFTFCGSIVYAQNRCVSVEVEKSIYKNFYQQKRHSFETFISQKIQEKEKQWKQNRVTDEKLPVYTIPVVVHVIHNGEREGMGSNVPDEQVFAQIDILNKDYRRKNQDTTQTQGLFKNVVADTYIEFVLAKQDPAGNTTDGIVRVKGNKTRYYMTALNDRLALSSLSMWDPNSYLNIWVCDAGTGVLGYAQFPVSDLDGTREGKISPDSTDGVYINYRAFGLDYYSTATWNFAKGRTATHEIGHYLGLNHIWGDKDYCDGTDYCDDTPPQEHYTIGCEKKMSCGGLNMIENFLDYTNDQCMNSFTKCQRTRMRIVLENSIRRKSLLVSKALYPPPVVINDIHDIALSAEDISFVVDALSNITIAIENKGNKDINGFELSKNYNGVVEKIFYPDTIKPIAKIHKKIPFLAAVKEKNTLSFSVTLSKSEINLLNNTVERAFYLFNPNTLSLPVLERFSHNEPSIFTSFGSLKGGHTWQKVSDSTNTSHIIMKAPLFSNKNFKGDTYWLVSNRLNMQELTEASLFFDVAYSSAYNLLYVFASDNGGKNWTSLPYQNINKNTYEGFTEYYPKQNDWEKKHIDLSQYAGNSPIQIAFVAINNGENNIFLDNIEFFVSADPNPVRPEKVYVIYPNPSSEQISISFSTEKKQNISLEMLNMEGQSFFYQTLSNVLNQTYSFPTNTIPRGIYIMKIQTETFTSFEKIILR